MFESQELSQEDCLRLLRSGVFGRVAVMTPDGPHIVPVNYAVIDDAIVFRTTPYSVVGTYGRNTLMSFEVDHVDYEYSSGWSVVARGRGDAVTDARKLDEIAAAWRPKPWASGTRNLIFSIRWNELTGRRLGPIDWRKDVPTERMVTP